MQKLVDGVWVDFEFENLVDGDVYRIPIGGQIIDGVLVGNGWDKKVYFSDNSAATKFVGMAVFGELLPDEVLLEIEDFKTTTTEIPARRRIAARILARIYADVKVDVLSTSFSNMLTGMVNQTSLTQEQADNILNTLS